MASLSESDFSCPVCLDVFNDPVVLPCSHSFCKLCLQTWWSDNGIKKCPVCKTQHFLSDPPRNLVLKKLCEAFLLEREQKASTESEPLCSLHSEKLKLFCLDHQQPVCVVCRDSKTHSDHRFRPIAEAAEDHREKLQESLKPLQDKLKIFQEVKGNFDQTAGHIKVQAKNTKRQIKEQFEKLHRFLQEEEEARISALTEEEEQKSQKIKKKIEAVSREISSLSDTIRVTEEELRAKDISFLQNYKAAVERVQRRPLLDDPQLISGALIDVAKHLGNLTYNIWNQMKKMVSFTPVVLDPNTNHPELILSEDLTSVRCGRRQNLPDNPERINFYLSALGSEGFDSGTHSWDVEVGDSPVWALGVSAKSVPNRRDKPLKLLKLVFCNGEYTADPGGLDLATVLPTKTTFKRIRVRLDCDKRRLSFSDPDTDTHIHTFTHTFTKRLFPYFNATDSNPLKISQVPFHMTM
ncbi:nuclear factor 7, ovary-like [Brachyistius frenatus]|uniref:nuclear factor 7, ovary-like n=1 Tax=Brachyistius frenatus TaxID=100188 RepID=UPI0037E9A91F